MKLFESKMADCLKKNLDQHNPSISFNRVWKKHKKNNKRILGIRRVVAVLMVAVFSLLVLLSGWFCT